MKHSTIVVVLSLIIAGCNSPRTVQKPTLPVISATEIACRGVEPKGISTGMQAYLSLSGKSWSIPIFQKASIDSTTIGALFHHIRVNLEEGPICSQDLAWWRVVTPDGVNGWVQIGAQLNDGKGKYTAAFLPFSGEAVQQDVPDGRNLEAKVRYILADIVLGSDDVLKYYKDQAAAKPDDPETKPVSIALKILQEAGKDNLLANPAAFERKPLRGGTSVVDAGTEFVQPGLDILLKPCDVPNPVVSSCKTISQ